MSPVASESPLIELNGVTKIYQGNEGSDDLLAVDSIDLEIGESEFITLVGPSGCGKTTLIRLITGLTQKTEGSVKLRNDEVTGPVSDVGFVFQEGVLMDWRTVLDNVLFPYEALSSAGKTEESRGYYESRARDLLEMVGLSDFHDSYPKQLSGGMKQRVAICRALLPDPPVLLMDEPFGSLDAFTRDQLNKELLGIWEETGKTIIFVTHNVEEAVYLSDRVVVLSARPGRISATHRIDIDRPRPLDIRETPEFTKYVASIRDDIEVYA